MAPVRNVIVIGLDGLEPGIVEQLMEAGELPHLASLAARGGYGRVGTTYPAQTPVAWSTFATGTNPGGHGIFDFIRRDPATYLPDIALNRYEQKRAFLPPKAVNLRRGVPVWEVLTAAGVPSTVIRCPCTYPPDDLHGRMLSGMGVPDVRGGFGTGTYYTSDPTVMAGESELVVRVPSPDRAPVDAELIGPRDPKTGRDVKLPLSLTPDAAAGTVTLVTSGTPKTLVVREGEWSGWVRVKFAMGRLQSVHGMVRFYLGRVAPTLALYASPVNFDPYAPAFPISAPWDYAGELAKALGFYHTTGMVEDHAGLSNGRFDEGAFLDQCDQAVAERERMMTYELDRLDGGLFYCLYDTPDRVQHMFWRFREPGHPANGGITPSPEWCDVIERHYRRCDDIVGTALEYADDRTLVMVLSDHGFGSFQRGFNINTWLHDNGLLALERGVEPGTAAGDMLAHVDWTKTKAYAVGLAGIYLNLAGREARGIVSAAEAEELEERITGALSGITDPGRGAVALRSVLPRRRVYSGPYCDEAPDLVVNFARGYRASWGTALGAVPAEQFEDNRKRWSGDHVVDPELIPGVLFMNRRFRTEGVRLADMAPTILDALGVNKGEAMEGEAVLEP